MVRSFALVALTAFAATAAAQSAGQRPARTPQDRSAQARADLQEELAELRAELKELRAVLAEITDRAEAGKAKAPATAETKEKAEKTEAKAKAVAPKATKSRTKAKDGEAGIKGPRRVRTVTVNGSPVEVVEVSPGSGTWVVGPEGVQGLTDVQVVEVPSVSGTWVVGPEGVRALSTVEDGETRIYTTTPKTTEQAAPQSSGCTCNCPCCNQGAAQGAQGEGAAKTGTVRRAVRAPAPVRTRSLTKTSETPNTFTWTQPTVRSLFSASRPLTVQLDRNCAPARSSLRRAVQTPAAPAAPEAQAAPVAPKAPKAPSAPKAPKAPKKAKAVEVDRSINV